MTIYVCVYLCVRSSLLALFNIYVLKVSFTEKPFNSSSFRNTIAHSKLHMHAARENDLLPPLPALANERKYTEKQADQKEPFFVT